MSDFSLVFLDKFIDLPIEPIVYGKIIYVVDTKEIYFDNDSLVRCLSDNVVIIETLEAAQAILLPDVYRIYAIRTTSEFYRYLNFAWVKVTSPQEAVDIFSSFSTFTPATMNVGGQNLAPRTLAECIILSDGQPLEDKLKNIAKMEVVVDHLVITEANQLLLPIPIPFPEFFANGGNYMQIFVGSVFVDNRRYKITFEGNLQFLSYDDTLNVGREITFIFFYNTYNANTTAISSNIDGRYIMNKSIQYNKIERLSSGYNLDDETSLATSQAVCRVYDAVLSEIAKISNVIAYCTAVGNGVAMSTTIQNYTLKDNAIIKLRLNTTLGIDSVLSINNGTSYPIYDGILPIEGGNAAGEILELVFSQADSKFYITGGSGFRLVTYNGTYVVPASGVSSIPIQVSPYNNVTDNLKVYQNNLRLFKEINYTISSGNILLKDYTATIGDVFYFEIDKIIKEKI